MKKKTIVGISIGAIGILLIGLLYWGYCFFFKEKEEISILNYNFTYNDETVPGSKYDFLVYDNKVEYEQTSFCSAIDCEPTKSKKTLDYSKENIEKLNYFIKKYDLDGKEVNYSDLDEYQRNVIMGIIIGELFFESSVEEYEFKLVYTESSSVEYNFYFNNSYIVAKKLTIDGSYDIEHIDTYNIEFKKDNMNLLFAYIKKAVNPKEGNIIYKSSTLYKDEENIIKSLVENDESYLENTSNDLSLLYEISYGGINCLTPTLRLYSDNTYEYYYTFTIGDKPLTPQKGTYSYDLENIISNIDKYEEDPLGPYTIKNDAGKVYVTYSTNQELKELLHSLNVVLEKCLESE